MAQENQVTKETQQVQQEPQRVTMKDPKKVEAGKRLAAINHKKREAKKREEAQNGGMNQYYGIGAVIAVGVIGDLGYYIYQTQQPSHRPHTQLSNPPQQPPHPPQSGVPPFAGCYVPSGPKTKKFEMD